MAGDNATETLMHQKCERNGMEWMKRLQKRPINRGISSLFYWKRKICNLKKMWRWWLFHVVTQSHRDRDPFLISVMVRFSFFFHFEVIVFEANNMCSKVRQRGYKWNGWIERKKRMQHHNIVMFWIKCQMIRQALQNIFSHLVIHQLISPILNVIEVNGTCACAK